MSREGKEGKEGFYFHVPKILKTALQTKAPDEVESLEKYNRSRAKVVDQISCGEAANALKKTTGKPAYNGFYDKLKAADDTPLKLDDAVKSALNKQLDTVKSPDAAIEKFVDQMAQLNTIMQEDKTHSFAAENYECVLSELKNEIDKHIEKQQADEVKQLDAFLKSSTLPTDVAEKLRTGLKSAQKEQIETLEKAIDGDIKKFTTQKNKDNDTIAFLANIAASESNLNSKPGRTGINELRERHAKDDEEEEEEDNISFEYDAEHKRAFLRGIKASEVPSFTSVSGREIIRSGDGFAISTGTFGFALSEADFIAMAEGAKAILTERNIPIENQGIKTSVQHDIPEEAEKLGKIAYEAALKAGFKLDNIQITVNGKEMKHGELHVDTSLESKTAQYKDYSGNARLRDALRNAPKPAATITAGAPEDDDAAATVTAGRPPGITLS